MVTGVVALGQLDDVVQNQDIAKKFGLEDLDMLIFGASIGQDTFNVKALTVVRVQFLSKPCAHGKSYAAADNFDSTSASRSRVRRTILSAPSMVLMVWMRGPRSLPRLQLNKSIAQ